MPKIQMKTPLVEIDGDEMTRVMWAMIKEILLQPHIDLQCEYYDLGLKRRDETGDAVTAESARAILRHGVGVKCATITPNAARMEEYSLKHMWKSPNATIRAMLDGTVFRAPILTCRTEPGVRSWKKPITIARHAFGDVYKAAECLVEPGCEVRLCVKSKEGEKVSCMPIADFEGGGVVMGMYNTDASITSFAKACFEYALATGQPLWFSTKDTIAKVYDGRFKEIFDGIYEESYKGKVDYFYTLIDDAVARVMRSEGGFIWACKNYDGDVMSDMVAAAFGSLSMMTSVLCSPTGQFEYEAAHGTVTRHYYRYLKGEETSTNPVATIFAWTGALAKRAELDGLEDLAGFAQKLEKAVIGTIESGVMTGDLAASALGDDVRIVSCKGFLEAVANNIRAV